MNAKVSSGLYRNASEVVCEALRQALARERENEWFVREAALGFAQLEAGQVIEVGSKEHFMALVRMLGFLPKGIAGTVGKIGARTSVRLKESGQQCQAD
ncbi:MAG: hypothetical protein QM627_07915 [Luteolibacter sp.]